MNNKKKKSQLVFDMKLVRKLLKMNGEVRFCPFCGKPVEEDCGCHKNIVIDEAVNATCKETGLTEGSHCDSCGTAIVEQIVIEK